MLTVSDVSLRFSDRKLLMMLTLPSRQVILMVLSVLMVLVNLLFENFSW